ncbi:MAG TPA: hypothetical protein VFH68_00050 [Polyangia bacterium]|nr:hypothetical protein [Polyangia bacterium]
MVDPDPDRIADDHADADADGITPGPSILREAREALTRGNEAALIRL